MAERIEDYGLIGDCLSAGLVSRTGSLDWLCLPRFDSSACFAALLGTRDHGRWLIAPRGQLLATERRYREATLILETDFTTADGEVTLVDFMPPRSDAPDVVRTVVGRRGRVPMRFELILRMDYGSVIPWVQRSGRGIRATAGPETVRLASDVALHGEGLSTVAEFEVSEGERLSFVLAWHPSHLRPPPDLDPEEALRSTEDWWRRWSGCFTYRGPWREAVLRSLITLKALTYAPTGGIVAAPTTSLPEQPGGVRNWDYRYCWLRDATFTLLALMKAGCAEEARSWRDWLLRAVAGSPYQLQAIYGIAGERRLPELVLDWLPGFLGSRPVRIGNAAHRQFQLDIYGEIADALHVARRIGIEPHEDAWSLERELMEFLEANWDQPDEGIWEVRGPRRHFTHSKVMAWVGLDRAIKGVERFGLEGPMERWRRAREEIRRQILRDGFDPDLGAFVQFYGSRRLDASLLMIPLVGFLPPSDPRVLGTLAAIESRLSRDGFVLRYETDPEVDGLPPGEGCFLACSFWLADNLVLQGRRDEARRVLERVLAVRNDLGLLAEEYDPSKGRQLGNFPQALSHVALIDTAMNLGARPGPAEERAAG